MPDPDERRTSEALKPTDSCDLCGGCGHVTALFVGRPTQFPCPACRAIGAFEGIWPTGGQPAPEKVEEAYRESIGQLGTGDPVFHLREAAAHIQMALTYLNES